MIASLAGRVARATPGEVVLETGGVGYRVFVPLSTYSSVAADGAECRLRVVTVVREDEISLYGFATAGEEDLFRLLQGVSGVGPKLALKILSGLSSDALQQAIAAGDLAVLTAIPGVGKKLAQRLVLELREKVYLAGAVPLEPRPPADRLEGDALEALESLGYPRKKAQQALRGAKGRGAETLEQLVRETLQALAPKR